MSMDDQLKLSFEQILPLLTVDEIYERASAELLTSLGKEDRRFERKPSGIHALTLGEYFSMWANTAPDGGLTASLHYDNVPINFLDILNLR